MAILFATAIRIVIIVKKIMKYIFYLLVAFCLVSTLSCKDDDANNIEADLFYDNGINSAPIFEAGTHVAAARFPRSITSNFAGQKLNLVEFYLINTPSTCKIKIFDEGTSTKPGTLLYEANVTSSAQPNAWVQHTLTDNVTITNKDIWLAVEFTHFEANNTIGCDVGPADENGDWVLEGNETEWETYRNFTSDAVNINWNIRGSVE